MNAEITYTDFNITKMENIAVGDYFLWSGNLYQKTSPITLTTEVVYNASRVKAGTFHSFFDEEPVVPVNVKIEVSQGG
tara:strand:- start:1944 stop:2177 length:234 start_codon:yes stop_codon:yes gene_type:complete